MKQPSLKQIENKRLRDAMRADISWQKSFNAKTVYGRRVHREAAAVKFAGTRHGRKHTGYNRKTGRALYFPITNCQPTKTCAASCYFGQGQIAFPDAIMSSVELHRTIMLDPIGAAEAVARESRNDVTPLRTAGGGEPLANEQYETFFSYLNHLGVKIFGFTRIPAVYEMYKRAGYNVMFSLDETSPAESVAFAVASVPVAARAWLAIPSAFIPSVPVGVIFPEHGPETDNVEAIPRQKEDCPAVRKHITCDKCRRCYLEDR